MYSYISPKSMQSSEYAKNRFPCMCLNIFDLTPDPTLIFFRIFWWILPASRSADHCDMPLYHIICSYVQLYIQLCTTIGSCNNYAQLCTAITAQPCMFLNISDTTPDPTLNFFDFFGGSCRQASRPITAICH